MKINPSGFTGINPYQKQMEKAEAVRNTPQKQDKVEISSAAKEMQMISTDRRDTIEKLKEQIQAGTYKIDAQAIAQGMLKFYSKK